MVEIRSPFPVHALPRAWGWLQAFKSRVADDFGPQTVGEWVDRTVSSQAKTWGVYRDGELGGMISFEQLSPWLGTAHCVFRKDFWGRETTRPAVRDALSEMFDSGIGKLIFTVFSDNREIRRLLSEFGAEVEAVFRKHTIRNGKPVNMKALAIFKETFDANACAGDYRSGVLNTRRSPVEPQQNPDQHDDAERTESGVQSAPGSPDGLQQRPDVGSGGRGAAD